jgi:hypothetical protein
LTTEQFLGHRYLRLKQIKKLLDDGSLNDELRWSVSAAQRRPEPTKVREAL